MNPIEEYRNDRKNRRCKFCVYMHHIGPAIMPPCIPDAWRCAVTDKLVKPEDRRPFCKYYSVNLHKDYHVKSD